MQKSRSKALTITASTIGVVAVAGAAFWIVDSAIAAHAEHNLSEAVAESANLDSAARVFLGGPIYSTSFFTGELASVSIDMLDVEIPGVGMVNARTEVESVEVTRDQVLSGDLNGATAETFARTIRMDGVAIGAQLGITDLDISHPINISPSGGLASEALLTGTPPDLDEPVSVMVSLRLVGSEFQMTPYELVDAPSGLTLDDVDQAFTWRVDTLQLPLSDRATAVYLSGGSIHFQSEARNVELTTRELSPLAAPEENSDESS
ncbi:hypothetical protein CDES_11715 [Corynebacterium deserti GIMN1.010]|uniref:Uncharacterized protein n=1 Tax=Corynebacterium deserti GIMN1.010 TaxID=931089 RepID=A0A0M4CNA3_9CORY|nr:DUF2993 domain-containing protein [Corynebacterium deserti]ALC06697.1 hypothetical protein CDES_11715 [Corynebacterium deserti GIMN1.010]